MANPTIQVKRSNVGGKVPTTSQVTLGEFAINTTDGKVYTVQESGGPGIGTTVISLNPWSVGVGSTAYNTFFTAGNVGVGTTLPTSNFQVVGNALISGVSTLGIVTSTNLTSQQLNVSGLSTFSGITTHTTSLFGTQASFSGVVTAVNGFSGNASSATYATNAGFSTNAGVSTSVIGGIGSITQLQVSGISTFSSGPVLIGAATSTGTATQRLQVTGGAYISSNTGIGTTNPQSTLQVKDALAFETTNTTTTTTNQVAIDSFSTTVFRSAKYQAQVTCPGQIATLGGITTGGRGYTAGTFNITFTTSSGTGSAAQGTLVVSNGTVGQISVSAGGTGYLAGDVLTAGGGSGLQVSVGTTDAVGAILTLGAITSAGIGYTSGVGVGTTSLAFLGGTGFNAVGLATIFDGVITSSTLLQQPTTGTGGTVYYSGSNYTVSSVLGINYSDVTNTIITITGDPIAGVSTLTSLTNHGLFINDIIQVSATGSGLTASTNYYVLSTPSTTTFTLGTGIGVGTYVGFNTTVTATGYFQPTTGIITGITTTSIAVGQYIKPVAGIIGAGTTVTAVGIGSVFINPVSLNVGVTSSSLDFGSYSFTSQSIGFYRTNANAGGAVTYTNAITGISTNYQVSDLLVLQNGTTADFVEYGTIANNDVLGSFSADISGGNARLLFTPTYPNNTIKVARQAITI